MDFGDGEMEGIVSVKGKMEDQMEVEEERGREEGRDMS
jgi:hypothetical protein